VPESLPDYFTDSGSMPKPSEFNDWVRKWHFVYKHYPTGSGMFKPKYADFKEDKTVYFLSPFKIIVIDTITAKGFPFCDNISYRQCWEYEQVNLKAEPKSIQDIGISMKMHFGIYWIKHVWGVSSVIEKETFQ
jgi:hypothetical protein